MSFPNQVWTFRLSKFEGVDRVDQVALQCNCQELVVMVLAVLVLVVMMW